MPAYANKQLGVQELELRKREGEMAVRVWDMSGLAWVRYDSLGGDISESHVESQTETVMNNDREYTLKGRKWEEQPKTVFRGSVGGT